MHDSFPINPGTGYTLNRTLGVHLDRSSTK